MTKKIKIISLVVVLVLAIGAFISYYFIRQSQLYLATNDAYVDGTQIVIAAPASGQLEDWSGHVGTTFTNGSTVGEVEEKIGDATTTVPIPVPAKSTIVQKSAVNGEFVAIGTPLAFAYNMNDLWVTANVKETLIHSIYVGAPVDITVDAYSHLVLHGVVKNFGLATANTFSLLPSSEDNANFTKVTQVMPVKIEIYGYQGIGLTPGMSVTVHIHKYH